MEGDVKRPFWAWVFSEADGTPSFARIFTGLIVCFSLGWVTHLVWKNHQLPDFAGLALFVTVLYGANRFSTILQKKD